MSIIKMRIRILICLACLMSYACKKDKTANNNTNIGTLSDIDGNIYGTVEIGTQIWMTENLKTSHYNDGSPIITNLDDVEWQYAVDGAYIYLNKNNANNSTYGKLYNWYAVNSGKLAPIGWHVPTYDEWMILINYLNGRAVAGGKLKSTMLWASPNTGATNSSLFNAIPAGICNGDASFNLEDENRITGFWSSDDSGNAAPALFLSYNDSAADIYDFIVYTNTFGLSIRCVKD